MMTEMTRYKQQNDLEDDCSSLGSTRTEELSQGTTRVRYHMVILGSHYWRSRTKLEKTLLVGWGIMLLTIIVLVCIVHYQTESKDPNIILLHNHDSVFGPCVTPDCVVIAGNVLQNMNLSVDPCVDFYEYACGGWNAGAIKPEGKATWGTLNKLGSDNQIIIRKALEEGDAESETEEKAKIFYRSCVDVNDTIEKRGGEPLFKILNATGGWSLYGDWKPKNYNLQDDIILSKVEHSSSALFTWAVAEDDKNSARYVLEFDQGGLMLATRDYYLNKTEKTVKEAYVKYITKIGVLLGAKENKSRSVAEDILSFETVLANLSAPDDQRRDDEKLYHNMTLAQLTKIAPFMDWTIFVNSAFKKVNQRLRSTKEVVVYAPDFLTKLSAFLKEKSLTKKGNVSIHNYLTWHMIKNYMGSLSRDFREAYSVLEKAQVGVSGGEAEWRECVASTNAALGPAVGAMYVRKAFSQQSKKLAHDMLATIRKAFRDNLNSVPWMDIETKKAALDKADFISPMIGYPDYILDKNEIDKKFKDLKLHENQFFENNINVNLFRIKESLNHLLEPVNKTKWDMSAPTVNAYYSPTKNNIAFPAGILQTPFFDKNNPRALNYGAVGVVMGHELSHGFDDQGRKYDKDGNLHNWWKASTTNNFNNKTQCMATQYSNYSLRQEHLNGNLTLGENIADNGGLKASFQAYKNNIKQDHTLPGLALNPSQLFFLGFAQVWCSSMTKEVAHLEILRDSHVLPQFRVKGTLSNSKEFSQAFKCPLNSPMNPEHKCIVW